jgi:hypothetical protein
MSEVSWPFSINTGPVTLPVAPVSSIHLSLTPSSLYIMCIDGNNAGHAAVFVNAQLEALYKVADDCVRHYAEDGIDRSKQSGYDFALREYYHYQSKTSPPIKFEFGKPEVEFVCNHDAILHLTITSVTAPTALEPKHYGPEAHKKPE